MERCGRTRTLDYTHTVALVAPLEVLAWRAYITELENNTKLVQILVYPTYIKRVIFVLKSSKKDPF